MTTAYNPHIRLGKPFAVKVSKKCSLEDAADGWCGIWHRSVPHDGRH